MQIHSLSISNIISRGSILLTINKQRHIQYMIGVVILALATLSAAVTQQVYLNNVPILFALQGTLTYVPNTGGVPIPGYALTVGFDRYSWLGIQFMSATSGSNYDTLVIQRSSSASGGAYGCWMEDYYIASGRPTVLMSDRITSMDQIVTSSSNSSTYQLTLPRTLGNTSGEDWEGGDFVEVCFFTADAVFSASVLNKQYSLCAGYQVDSYVSTYRGSTLGTMMFEGVSSRVYGGFYGPYLQLKLYWYRPNPTVTNTSSIIIRVGDEISEAVGYDYFVCGGSDYFGNSLSSLLSDLDYSGFNNGICSYQAKASSIQLSYSRDVLTYDSFDFQIPQTFSICLMGAQTGCATLSPPFLIPTMTVQSALQISESTFLLSLLLTACLLLAL